MATWPTWGVTKAPVRGFPARCRGPIVGALLPRPQAGNTLKQCPLPSSPGPLFFSSERRVAARKTVEKVPPPPPTLSPFCRQACVLLSRKEARREGKRGRERRTERGREGETLPGNYSEAGGGGRIRPTHRPTSIYGVPPPPSSFLSLQQAARKKGGGEHRKTRERRFSALHTAGKKKKRQTERERIRQNRRERKREPGWEGTNGRSNKGTTVGGGEKEDHQCGLIC